MSKKQSLANRLGPPYSIDVINTKSCVLFRADGRECEVRAVRGEGRTWIEGLQGEAGA